MRPCRRCRKPRPRKAVFHNDPYRSRTCMELTHGIYKEKRSPEQLYALTAHLREARRSRGGVWGYRKELGR